MVRRWVAFLIVLLLAGIVLGQPHADAMPQATAADVSADLLDVPTTTAERADGSSVDEPGHNAGHCPHKLTIRWGADHGAPSGAYERIRWNFGDSTLERIAFPPSHPPPVRAA